MSSSNDNLPPYQEKPSSTQDTAPPSAYPRRLAGAVQTCSLSDGQIDHFSIIQVSDSTYHLSLTTDPTPLYRIELILGASKIGNIQIFSASDRTIPCLAAARASPDQKSKTMPVGMICTSSPTEPEAHWRPVTLKRGGGSLYFADYFSHIPVVKVPGRAPEPQHFKWETENDQPARLWWQGPLPFQPRCQHTSAPQSMLFLFATVTIMPDDGETLVQIRRGVGIDFELSVILEAFLLLNLNMKPKSA